MAALTVTAVAFAVWAAALVGTLHTPAELRVAVAALTPPSLVLPPEPGPPPRTLTLVRLGTSERIDIVPFDRTGAPRTDAFETLGRLFQPSSGHEVPIDPRLAELLIRISDKLGEPLILVSGHREPGRGTSKGSYHVRGMAADIAVRGVGVQQLRRVALELGAGGVGLYPGFIHVDVRDEPYRWVGGRWPRRTSR